MAHDVFVSYAHQDRTVANAVCATLEAHGIRCWIAPRDILPGEDWGEAIIDALQAAKAMVLVFSSGSNDSDQIKREVERAVHQGIAVVPFRIEDVLPSKTLEYFISTQHWLDALTPPLEEHLEHLAETITVLLAKKALKEKTRRAGDDKTAFSQMERRPEDPPKEPPPPIMASAPPRKVPLIWLGALAGLLVVLVVAAGLWWHWSQPVVSPPKAPAPVAPVTKPPVAPAPPVPQQPVAQQPKTSTTPPGPTVRVQDGKFILAPEVGHVKVVLNQDTILPNDMDASVSMTFQKADDPSVGSGLVFWAQDYSNYYVLSLNHEGGFLIQRYAGNRWLAPVGWRTIDSAKKGENVENILRVVTKGNEATAYVNGQEIISFTGEPPQGGSLIGFKSSTTSKGVNVAAFANLKVICGSQVYGFHPDPKEPNAIRLVKQPASAPPVTPAPQVPQQPVAQQPKPPTTPPGPTVRVQDWKFILAPAPGRSKMVLNQDTILPNDMDASVSLTFEKAEAPTWSSGLVFWAKDDSEYYALLVNANGWFAIQHRVANRYLLPVAWQESNVIKKGEGAENQVKVVTKGDQATAYINGIEIISFTGEPPQGGSLVGLKVASGPQGMNAGAFANLKVIGASQVYDFHPDPKEPNAIRFSKRK